MLVLFHNRHHEVRLSHRYGTDGTGASAPPRRLRRLRCAPMAVCRAVHPSTPSLLVLLNSREKILRNSSVSIAPTAVCDEAVMAHQLYEKPLELRLRAMRCLSR